MRSRSFSGEGWGARYRAQVNAGLLVAHLPPHLRNLVVTRTHPRAPPGSSAAAAKAALLRQAANAPTQARTTDNLASFLAGHAARQVAPVCMHQNWSRLQKPWMLHGYHVRRMRA